MSSKRIKKPIRRKKKSDYPGEMSFRKALGNNPIYYQEDNSTIPVTVKYGSPEYEQAYNQGTLVRASTQDDILRARTLPEFKVTPQYTNLSDDLRYLALEGSKGLSELTGVPGTVRFARNPVQSLKGAGNTLVDLGLMAGASLSPVGRFDQMNPMGGMQYATQGINPLTGEGSYRAEDVEGAFNTLDAVGTATVLGSALKAPLKQGLRQTAKNNLFKTLDTKKTQFSKALQGSSNLFNEIIGELKQGKLNRKSIEEGNKWLQNYINHPSTQMRIDIAAEDAIKNIDQKYSWLGNSPEDIPFKQALINEDANFINLVREQTKKFKPNSKEYSLLKQFKDNLQQYLSIKAEAPIHLNNWGVSYMHNVNPSSRELIKTGAAKPFDRYGSWISRTSSQPQPNRVSTTIHEGGHDWLSAEAFETLGQRKIALDPNNVAQEAIDSYLKKEQLINEGKTSEEILEILGEKENYVAYLAEPTEQHARIMELRAAANLPPDYSMDEATAKKMLEWIKSGHSPVEKSFAYIVDYDANKLKNLFNKFLVAPTIMGVGAAGTYGANQLTNQQQMRRQGGKLYYQEDFGLLPTLYVGSKTDPRYLAYRDSLDIFNLNKQIKPGYSELNLPQITEEEFDRLVEKDDNLTNWNVDWVQYRQDKSKGKVKDFEDYIYSGTNSQIHNHPLYLKNNPEVLDEDVYTEEEEKKHAIPLKNGVLKVPEYGFKGKPVWNQYYLLYPNGTKRHYYKDDLDSKPQLLFVDSPNILPLSTNFYGADTLLPKGTISSTGWYAGPKPSYKTLYTNYDIPLDIRNEYKKPVQPVIYKPGYKQPQQEQPTKENNPIKQEVSKVISKINTTPRNIHQFPFRNPVTGKTEDRVSLITPAHQYIMNMNQYGKLRPTDSIPQEGNYLYRTNYKELGGNLRFARGGSLTSAQDTAQAADLNKDVMRKDTKKATVWEDIAAAGYGIFGGAADAITFGLTDELTDAGFKGLQAAAGHDVNSEEAKRQAGIKGWGNIGGAVGGAFINPGAMGSAIEEGMEGLGQGIKGIDPNSPTATGIGTALEGMGSTKAFTGLNNKDKIPEGMEGFSKIFMARNGGRFRYGYQGGGHMLNQNMGLTEIDGPSHEEGGVTLPNNGGRPDVEVEGPETIYTPENYVMSEKMKASLEALEFAGITGKAAKRLAGKSYADLSKMIKSKAGDKLRPNDPLSKKMLDKEMKKLMMAHEYDREAKRMQEEAMRSQMMGGSNIIAETPEERAGGYNMYPNAQSIAFPGSGPTSVVPTYNNDPIMVTGADGSQQMLTDEPIETEAPFIEEKMAQGGKMIKRADGSYSRKGLWDYIRENKGSGKKPTQQMLEQEAKIKAAEKAYGGYYAEGGSFDNPGFRALPDYVQAKIKSNMEVGGYMGDYIGDDDTMEYGEGGYTVRRSNDRKGKTHVVIGPDGTKKYFGDPKLGERGKSKYGKDAFYARHKKNLAKNPYFRAYARATWEDGGYMDMLNANVDIPDMEAPMYAYGGPMMYAQGGIHIDPAKRGTFKAQASKMGMGVQEAARTILNAPEGKYSPAMRKKANFARNFAKEYGGYYQMGGEMMQAPQQGQPQGGGGEEQILQQVAQMLQQGMSPEEIVGQLVQMGVPQEQAIQIVQMVVQQMQGQQQAPQQAPPMMRGGGYMYQMGGEMAPQQQAQGGAEQIVQAIMQMLQQGMQPEEIVAQLVQMGLPQEAAIQAVQMVMQQSQQGQQQQPQPPYEQGMMGSGQPPMRYGGRYNPLMRRNGGKLYYQDAGSLPDNTSTLENILNDNTIESGVYQGNNAIAIGNQANANANANTGIEPILFPRPSLKERAIYLGNVNAEGSMPSVNNRFNPELTMTPQEKTNWLNKTRGYSGLLPESGYKAIDMFENTMGTYDSKGNPTSMNMPEGYSKTGGSRPEAVTETEKYINNTIGIDTWNSLPDDIKTLWYDASFNSTDNKEYFLRALAQAVQDSDPNFQYPQNIGYTDNDYKNYRNNLSDQQALEIIRNADFTKNDVTGNFINILNQQRKSIGNRSGFPENYMPTFNRRAIDVYNNFQNLNSNQSSNPQPGNTTSAAPTVVSQATAAPSNNQSNLKIGILNKPSNTPAGNFQRINPEVYIPGAYTPPTSIGFNAKPPVNMMQPPSVKNNYRRDPSLFKIPLGTPSASTPANNTEPPLPEYESPMGNYIAGGVGSMFGPLANAAAAAFAPDPTYTAAPKFKKFDYTPVALQRAAGNQAMANTRQAIRMGAPTQGSYLANVGVSMPSAGAQIGSQVAQTRYGIDSQNIGLMNQEAQLRAAQAEKNALMKDQSISNRWKLGMEAAAGVGRNIQGFSKDMGAKEMQDQLLNQLRTGDFAIIGYDNVNGTLVPKLAPAGVATYNDGTITLSNGQRARRNPDTGKYEIIPQ